MVLLFAAYFLNKERVKTKPKEKEKGAAGKAVGILLRSRSFVTISLTAMLLLAGQMFTQSFYTYLFDDYFHANWMNLASQACTYSPMLIFMFLLPGMAKKIGKKEISAAGVLAAAAANLFSTRLVSTITAVIRILIVSVIIRYPPYLFSGILPGSIPYACPGCP